MQKTKLLSLLKSLDIEQLKELSEFISLGFLKLEKIDKQVIKWLITSLLKKKQVPILKSTVIKQVFKNDPAIEKNWKHILSRSFIAANKYLVYSLANKRPSNNLPLLLFHYTEHGLTGKMSKVVRQQLEAYLEKEGSRDYHYHLYKFYIQQSIAIEEKHHQNTSQALDDAMLSLDTFHFENKLRLGIEILTKSIDYQNNYKEQLIEQYLTIRDEIKTDEAVLVFSKLFDHVLNGKQSNLDDLIDAFVLEDKFSHFDKFQKKSIVELFLNYCLIRINSKQVSYVNKYLQAINYLEQQGIILDSKHLSWQRFKNILTASLLADQKFKKTKTDINRYIKLLPSEIQEGAQVLAYANFEFDEAKIKDAISSLSLLHPKRNIEKISMWRLLIKLQFEAILKDKKEATLEWNQVKKKNSILEACRKFERYLKSEKEKGAVQKHENRLSDRTHLYLENFIFYTRKLTKRETIDQKIFEQALFYGIDYLWLASHMESEVVSTKSMQ